jgi:hypothetical protein
VTFRARAAPEVELEIELPEGARDGETHEVDVSVVPGASVSAHHAWTGTDAQVELVCATAGAGPWIPGLEGAVLHGATGLVRSRAGLSSVRAGEVAHDSHGFGQRFTGDGLSGRHLLGFADGGDVAFLCTAVCRGGGCERVLDSLHLAGELASPPERGALVRLLSEVGDRPTAALGVGAAAIAGAIAIVLWRRPRPRW